MVHLNRVKHIKVRFFWLKNLINEDEIILMYVLSEELVADMLLLRRQVRPGTSVAGFWECRSVKPKQVVVE